jgi:hypothetical protein
MSSFDTPILLIAWRRPHTLSQVIDAIRPVSPSYLFVACDGPNPNRVGESEKVALTRQVIENQIDWPCMIQTLYSDVNQGCYFAVSRAISWFFNQVEEGIILEDDCVPHPDFFPYCFTLLERYRHDKRVWCISGNNFQNGHWRGDGSYYYSRYSHCWGWATWRNRWQYFDADSHLLCTIRDSGLMSQIFFDPLERQFWSCILERISSSQLIDSWAYIWFFTCLFNGGLTTLPNCNLVRNVGFGPDATHTNYPLNSRQSTGGLNSYVAPTFILRDAFADALTFRTMYQPLAMNTNGQTTRMVKSLLNAIAIHVTRLISLP